MLNLWRSSSKFSQLRSSQTGCNFIFEHTLSAFFFDKFLPKIFVFGQCFFLCKESSVSGYTCALLVSSSSSGSSSSKLTSFMGASFKTNAALECQDGVQQNVSTLRMGHSHINKLYAGMLL